MKIEKSEGELLFDRYKILGLRVSEMSGVLQNLDFLTSEDVDYWKSSVLKFKKDFTALVNDTEAIVSKKDILL
jgi:hypothetical protein